jgi:hypothetical protein
VVPPFISSPLYFKEFDAAVQPGIPLQNGVYLVQNFGAVMATTIFGRADLESRSTLAFS